MVTQALTNRRPISSRKADTFHIFFILLSVLISFTLDFPGMSSLFPDWTRTARLAYLRDSNDPLYVLDPPFFQLLMWVSVFALVPGGLVTVWALFKDHKLAPLYLLVYSTYYVTTSAVCYIELIGTKDWPREDIKKLEPPYIIFGLIALAIMLDAFLKVKSAILGKQKST